MGKYASSVIALPLVFMANSHVDITTGKSNGSFIWLPNYRKQNFPLVCFVNLLSCFTYWKAYSISLLYKLLIRLTCLA